MASSGANKYTASSSASEYTKLKKYVQRIMIAVVICLLLSAAAIGIGLYSLRANVTGDGASTSSQSNSNNSAASTFASFQNFTLWAINNITADLVQTKIELNETKNELAKTRNELAKTRNELTQLNISRLSGDGSVAALHLKLAQASSLFDVC